MSELVIKKDHHRVRWALLGAAGLAVAVIVGVVVWYCLALLPVDARASMRVGVEVTEGMTPSSIGTLLEEKKLIRSSYVFDVYTRLSGTHSKLQAGSYRLSPSQSLQSIVNDLASGKVDQLTVTFLPGATVAEDKQALTKAGYSAAEADTAFAKKYNHPLFASKPLGGDLEGYIYGDTYSFNRGETVDKILMTTFNEYNAAITTHNLAAGFKKQGLSLFRGITLASIVQREVSGVNDQRQVAQIFLKRLNMNMPLGSDVTYHYAAKKLGVAPSPTLDSPYNTRIYAGLPPGPIASPGLSALEAVANPASGDYLYFLSGDDGRTYFATTEQEHQANIDQHCKIKCSVF